MSKDPSAHPTSTAVTAASLSISSPSVGCPELVKVGDIARALSWMSDPAVTNERVQAWASARLLKVAENQGAGTGRHRNFDQTSTVESAVLSALANLGIHVAAQPYLPDVLDLVRRAHQTSSEGKTRSDLFLEISRRANEQPIFELKEAPITPSPNAYISILVNLTEIFLKVSNGQTTKAP